MASPLTHHEILALIEPFTRRGRHADLQATDRIARRLVFNAIEHPAASESLPAAREVLQLENPEAGRFRLTRLVRLESGIESRLAMEGEEPGAMLDAIDTIALSRQYAGGPGYGIVRSFRLERPERGGASALILTRAEARIGGIDFHLDVPKAPVRPAEFELSVNDGGGFGLSEDMLAVLGWSWGMIRPRADHWRGTLLLRRREPGHSRDAEEKFDRATAHLARTLSEPPARFHERFVGARWNVAFRRMLPILVCLGVLAVTFGVRALDIPDDSVGWLLAFHAPPLLFAIYFSLPEIPRIEIPPVPRPSTAPSWRGADPAAG